MLLRSLYWWEVGDLPVGMEEPYYSFPLTPTSSPFLRNFFAIGPSFEKGTSLGLLDKPGEDPPYQIESSRPKPAGDKDGYHTHSQYYFACTGCL